MRRSLLCDVGQQVSDFFTRALKPEQPQFYNQRN